MKIQTLFVKFSHTCLRLYVENFDARQCMHVSDLSSGTQCAATVLGCVLLPSEIKWK